MPEQLEILRAELHLLMEQEGAALYRALQLRKSGDARGSDREMAAVEQIRIRRGEVQRSIKEIIGPPILV
jgi:hypothetical protein